MNGTLSVWYTLQGGIKIRKEKKTQLVLNMQSIRNFGKVSSRCCGTSQSLSNTAIFRGNSLSRRISERNLYFRSVTCNISILFHNLQWIEIESYSAKRNSKHTHPLWRTEKHCGATIRSFHTGSKVNKLQIMNNEVLEGKRNIRCNEETPTKAKENEPTMNRNDSSSKRLNSPSPGNPTSCSMFPKRQNPWSVQRDYGTSTFQKIPEPQGLPLLGSTLSLILSGGAEKLHEYVDNRHKELGPIYRDSIGPVKAVFISSPDEFRRIIRLEGSRPKHLLPDAWILYNEIRGCQRGLFFMEGDEWLRFRRIMNKLLLRPESTDFMIGPCEEAAERLVKNWKSYAKQGIPIQGLESQLYQWSIEVILATLLGSTWPKYRTQLLLKSANLAGSLHKIFEYSAQLSLLPVKWAMNLKLPAWRKFVGSVDDAMDIVKQLVHEMNRLGGDGLIRMLTLEGVTGDDLVRIVADLILAAGDTTAYSTQWTLFLLGSHPDTQEKLFESLKDMDPAEVNQSPLLKGVLKEALRLFPTAPFLTRFLPEGGIIGGYRVQNGELVILSLYSSGRDSMNFPEPERFHPERWIRTERGDYNGVINPHATLPFALGARSCVGRKIAETQMMSTVAKLTENFKIECTNTERVQMILHLVSVPSEPVLLRLTSRK